jgi:hypothetical protein
MSHMALRPRSGDIFVQGVCQRRPPPPRYTKPPPQGSQGASPPPAAGSLPRRSVRGTRAGRWGIRCAENLSYPSRVFSSAACTAL